MLIASLATWGNAATPEALRVEVLTGVPSGLALRGEDANYRIVIQNHSAVRQTGTCAWSVNDDLKQTARQGFAVDLAPGASSEFPIHLETVDPGYQVVNVAVQSEAGEFKTESALAVVEKPVTYGKDDPRSFFATMFVHDPEVASRMGIKTARLGPTWGAVEPKPGIYDWAAFDARIAELRNHGIGVVLGIRPELRPKWAEWKSLEELATPQHIEDYRKFVTETVQRYRDQVDAVEIVNEPDLACAEKAQGATPTTEIYATLLREGYRVVKEIRPDLPVVGLSVSGVDFPSLRFSTETLTRQPGFMDAIGGHPYSYARYVGNGAHPESPLQAKTVERFASMAKLMKDHGLKPRIWSTEFGWALHRSESLASPCARLHAAFVAQAVILAREVPELEKLFLFSLAFPGYERDNSYGLFRGESAKLPHIPTPSAVSFATCVRLLDDVTLVRDFNVSSLCHVVRFRENPSGRQLFVVWIDQPDSMGGGATLRLPQKWAGDIGIWNAYGKALPSSATLMMDAMPLFFSTSTETGDQFEDFLKNAPPQPKSILAVRGASIEDSRNLEVDIANNSILPRAVKLYLKGAADEALSHLLPPGISSVRIPLASSLSGKGLLSINILDETTSGHQDFPVPFELHPVEEIGKKGLAVFPWTVIAGRDAILPADPGIDWSGPQDLSLRFRTGWTHDAFVLEVEVTDDVHIAPPKGVNDLWNYDSLQLAFDFKKKATDTYDDHCREFMFALGAEGARAEEVYPDIRPVDSSTITVTRNGTTTRYMIKLPWKFLKEGVSKPGDVYRMNFIVNDNDGKKRKYWMGPTPGISESKRPSVFWQWINQSQTK